MPLRLLERKYSMAALSVAGAILLSVASSGASAETTPSTACFVAPARLADDQVNLFLRNPQALLTEFASGGLPLSNRVRSLAGSSDQALDAILSLIPAATATQKAAIGAGLARTAKACATVMPDYAQLIQTKVAGLNDSGLLTAFATALSDTQTAALGAVGAVGAVGGIGGGGAIGGGGGGAGGAGGGSNGVTAGDSSINNPTSSFSVSAGGQFFASSVSSGTQ